MVTPGYPVQINPPLEGKNSSPSKRIFDLLNDMLISPREPRKPSLYMIARETVSIFLLILLLDSCGRLSRESITLSYFRLGWSQPDESPRAEASLQRFTREHRVQVTSLPVPETTLDQLTLSRKLLESGSGPDVLGLDLIWTGVLEGELLDLRPYLNDETSPIQPRLLNAYSVNEKLVAIPLSVSVGVLKYRVDLIREYGYHHPPTTWNQLEAMAARIQAGERAKGKKNFWGYVWQGAAAESLTCNALEWQIAEGGGRIIESDRTISVNNPGAIRAWKRAKGWIGWISPPSVLTYREHDSGNSFDSGVAAFSRVWGLARIDLAAKAGEISLRMPQAPENVAYARIPGGPGGRAGTLGGSGIAISRRSTHPREAFELVRFLFREELTLYKDEQVTVSASLDGTHTETWNWSDVVTRPSNLVGNRYDEVASAYIEAVHSVLAGQIGAKEAARELEERLAKITGFPTGPPEISQGK